MLDNEIVMGIGFATGRRHFRKVVNAYAHTWDLAKQNRPELAHIRLVLFVAYDLAYAQTRSTDFTNLPQDVVDVFDDIVFVGANSLQRRINRPGRADVIAEKQAMLLFGGGYAGKRNAILYSALDYGADYLLYLDDDEYPMAVTKNGDVCLWGGQHVIREHLRYIESADITNGHHCGYISPIPQIAFDRTLTEASFQRFIEAISNDIISWDSIREKIRHGGITYANTDVLRQTAPREVKEINHCKFISGSNLCLNLTRPERTFPFYNPPGARGEDTFLSTLLTERTVGKIPCYTFHDGFSTYRHLLDGVLPLALKPIVAHDKKTVQRFFKACVGWIRYKPLLTFITRNRDYTEIIADMRASLQLTIPPLCRYFEWPDFAQLTRELDHYDRNVRRHFAQFSEVQRAWRHLIDNRMNT